MKPKTHKSNETVRKHLDEENRTLYVGFYDCVSRVVITKKRGFTRLLKRIDLYVTNAELVNKVGAKV